MPDFDFLLYIFIFFLTIIGAAFGSFINVVVWRVPEKMSLIVPSSHCPKCKTPIRWFDNIPILSWFVLKGKCRTCKKRISIRYPLVEITSTIVALIIACSLFLNSWTGSEKQTFYWDEFANLDNTRFDFIDNDFVSSTFTSRQAEQSSDEILISIFWHALYSTLTLAVLWLVVIDLLLTLGIVEWDRGFSPKSLLYFTIFTLIVVAFVIFMINDTINIRRCVVNLGRSILLGSLAPLVCQTLIPHGRLGEFILVNVIFSVAFGYIVAFPIGLFLIILSYLIKRKTGKQILGIGFFLSSVILLLLQGLKIF